MPQKREIDLHPDVAEYLRHYTLGKSGLLFHTASGTPPLYGNLEDRWLTPRLTKMKLDEKGMGWHSFKRFRKTWLRGARCLDDINNFWMATNRRPCPSFTLISTRNLKRASRRSSVSVMASPSRKSLLLFLVFLE